MHKLSGYIQDSAQSPVPFLLHVHIVDTLQLSMDSIKVHLRYSVVIPESAEPRNQILAEPVTMVWATLWGSWNSTAMLAMQDRYRDEISTYNDTA